MENLRFKITVEQLYEDPNEKDGYNKKKAEDIYIQVVRPENLDLQAIITAVNEPVTKSSKDKWGK